MVKVFLKKTRLSFILDDNKLVHFCEHHLFCLYSSIGSWRLRESKEYEENNSATICLRPIDIE